MITRDGYSKDKSIMPEGIVITWSRDLIEESGGLLPFVRYFLKCMADEETYWLQKCRNAPKMDIVYVYIIVNNRLAYRCYYGGHQTGVANITKSDGRSWSYSNVITWPRIIMAGPVKKAPFKRELKGFRGFRYCTKLF